MLQKNATSTVNTAIEILKKMWTCQMSYLLKRQRKSLGI